MSASSESALSVFGAAGIKSAAHVHGVIRQGHWASRTSGLASEHVQGNLVILPAAEADDFLRHSSAMADPARLMKANPFQNI